MKNAFKMPVFVILMLVAFSQVSHAQWVSAGSALSNTSVWALAVSGNRIFAGIAGQGIYLSDDGTNWTASASFGSDTVVVRAITGDGGALFAGTNAGVFFSADNGATWISRDSGLTDSTVSSFAVNGNTVFAGTNRGVFLSSNNGASWTPADSGLSNTHVWCLASAGDNIFAGTSKGVFLSTGNGALWTPVDSGITNSSQYSKRPETNANTTIWSLATIGTNVFAGTDGGGVFLSGNWGASWTPFNSGLTNQRAGALYVWCLAAVGGSLFAGTDGDGAFLSINASSNWASVNSGFLAGLTNSTILSLAAVGGKVFAGTVGGLYSRPLSEMVGSLNKSTRVAEPLQSGLTMHFTGKANREISIEVPLSRPGLLTANLFDLSGHEMGISFSKWIGSGQHIITWNACNIATGCYIVRIQVGSEIYGKNVVITR